MLPADTRSFILTVLDAVPGLAEAGLRRDVTGASRKAVYVNVQALSSRGYPSPLPDSGPAYARARDGLRAFDAFGDEIRRRQNALQPPPAPAHGSASASASGHVATATLGGALAAYLASEAGQKTLGTVAHAVVDFAKSFFEAGPEQLPLPLA